MSTSLQPELFDSIGSDNNLMVSLIGSKEHSEPMYAHVEDKNSKELWFFMSKTNRVALGGDTMIQFVSKGHDMFACMHGRLVEEARPEYKQKFWSNQVEAWFEKGLDDPDLLMMRFELIDGEVWKQDPTIKGFAKLMLGSQVKPEELGEHQVLD
jgi:general stress protein 26